MKTKALIVGALPQPFEGPWVKIDDADAWRVVGADDYGEGNVVLDVMPNEALPGSLLATDASFWPYEFSSGAKARVVILREVPNVPHVSVSLEAIRDGKLQPS